MKISLAQLEYNLDKKLTPIYLLSGDETLLKQEARLSICKKAKRYGFDSHLRFNADSNWEEVSLAFFSNSFFSEKKIIEFDFELKLPNKTGQTLFTEYINHYSDAILVIIHFAKLEEKIQKANWFQSLEKNGTHITVWPIQKEELPRWIRERARRYHLQLTNEAALHLASYVEGNLFAAKQALEKLYLLNPENEIDIALIESVLHSQSHYTLFDLVDAIFNQNKNYAFKILNVLKNEGIDPILILWVITREIRILIDCLIALRKGISLDMLFKKHRIFPKRQPKINHAIKQISISQCENTLTQAIELDFMIKGLKPGNVWDNLELLILRFWK